MTRCWWLNINWWWNRFSCSDSDSFNSARWDSGGFFCWWGNLRCYNGI